MELETMEMMTATTTTLTSPRHHQWIIKTKTLLRHP
jgi:hypothetical protein